MIHRQSIFTLASAAVLSLALGQAAAQPEAAAPSAVATPPAAPAPAAPEPATGAAAPGASTPAAPSASTSAEAMREKMEKRHAEAMAERNKRYAELRLSAAEVGLDLPEMPPWEQAGMPMMPEGMRAMPQGMPEAMMSRQPQMTAEERQAMREQRWEAMRARAAERGMELPETPPWEAAEQRRKEMQERFEQYRATIEAMSEEQKEAIEAIFGGARAPMERPVMPQYGMPCGQYGHDCAKGYGPGIGQFMAPGRFMGPYMEPSVGPGSAPAMMPPPPLHNEPNAPAAPEQPAG